MLGVAYIGNGKSTNRYHLPFVLQLKDLFEVRTIVSRSQSVWSPIEGVTYTRHLEDVWQDEKVDLVVVATPLSSHFELAKAALEQGKHVLVEKPFTETVQEAKFLFDLAREKGLVIQAYQNRRFDADFLTLQSVIASGKLGSLLEVEMHFDYFRPEIPHSQSDFQIDTSYLYGHACHTIDQVVSYFGQPASRHLEVRSLLGPGRMNDYFDLDFFYGDGLKVSIKSSYFRIKSRPSFVAYGQKGMFIKEGKDRQEEHLKLFYLPGQEGFGLDLPEHYGTITYIDDQGHYHEEKVVSQVGDYGRYYQALYASIVEGADKLVTDDQTLYQIEVLETGIAALRKEERNDN